MGLSNGSRLGPYEVVGLLGSGGMGEVYRARDPRLGRDVAIKVLPASFGEDQDRLRRFEKEARAAGALNHPNLVTVFDVGSHEGGPFLVLELLEGSSLRTLLGGKPLPVKRTIEYAAQIAAGLTATHERGIVHRDLKPENVFVTREGLVKILDFGLAKTQAALLSEAGESGAMTASMGTERGVILGTVGYMSPEQLTGKTVDARSDIFSFGAVLYEMLSGRRAFRGATAVETMGAILNSDPVEVGTAEQPVPPTLERIVARCLAKEPGRRFQTANDLGFALAHTSGASAAGAAAPGASRPWGLGPGVALGGLVLATLVILAVALSRRPAAQPFTSVRFQVSLPDGVAPARFPTASSLALSPDGRQLALVALAKGRSTLWVRVLDRLEATALEGTEGAASPFWSPDGRMIAFFAGGELKKIPAAGGPAETLCGAEFGNAGAWGPDGTVLFTEWAGEREGLYRIPSKGGTPTALALRTAAGPETGIAWPAFLPDGRRFVYLNGAHGRRPIRTIAVASLDSPEARPVATADSRPVPVAGGRLLFVREGTLLVQAFDPGAGRLAGDPTPVTDLVWFMRPSGSAEFAASADGRVLAFRGPLAPSHLAWLDRSGREIGRLGSPAIMDRPALSPDGRRAAFDLETPRTAMRDIWVHDLVRDVGSRFTLDPLGAVSPIWSPDGERLLYASASQGGPLQMRIRRSDGSGSEEGVLRTDRTQIPQDWSPDGRWILYGDFSPARRPQRQLWLVPLDGERRPTALESTPVSRFDGRFAPDGRAVAFLSEETGRPEVFIASLTGSGRRQQVSTAGGRSPRWRRDGRELFYLSLDGHLMAVALGTGPDGEMATPRELFAVDIRGETTYDVDARGERFLFCLGRGDPPPIVVTVGWDAARKE